MLQRGDDARLCSRGLTRPCTLPQTPEAARKATWVKLTATAGLRLLKQDQ